MKKYNENCFNKKNFDKIFFVLQKLISKEFLDNDVINYITSKNFKNERLGITCSGGIDSVFMLFTLYICFPQYRSQFVVLHFNHKTRSKESDKDEQLVKKYAQYFNLEYFSGKNNLVNISHFNESYLRKIRHDFFHKTITKLNGNILFFGHHQDDIAETMIMRLARGSGSEGLSAPRPIQFLNNYIHIRPLLKINKTQIITICKKSKMFWREDASNQSLSYTRNIVRHNILNQFKLLPPGNALTQICYSRQLLEEDERALQEWINQLINLPLIEKQSLDFTVIHNKPIAILRRIIYKWLYINKINNFKKKNFIKLLNNIISQENISFNVGLNQVVELNKNILSFYTQELTNKKKSCLNQKLILLNKKINFFETGNIKIEKIKLTKKIILNINLINSSNEAYIKFEEELNNTIYVRSWLYGDKYKPLGSSGRRKLQDMFTDKKIPLIDRKTIPVFINSLDEILWVPGFPPAEEKKILSDSQFALRLTYNRL